MNWLNKNDTLCDVFHKSRPLPQCSSFFIHFKHLTSTPPHFFITPPHSTSSLHRHLHLDGLVRSVSLHSEVTKLKGVHVSDGWVEKQLGEGLWSEQHLNCVKMEEVWELIHGWMLFINKEISAIYHHFHQKIHQTHQNTRKYTQTLGVLNNCSRNASTWLTYTWASPMVWTKSPHLRPQTWGK